MAPHYFKGATGGIFIYDLTRYSILNHLNDWLNVLNEQIKKVPILLVGGKLDLDDKRSVNTKEAIKLVGEKNFYDFFECSSKTGQNVNIIFETMAKSVLEEIIFQ